MSEPQTYLVGGAVRDALLGIEGSDRDWVVVGATVEHMLAQGFQAVGKDFPVFLHPVTREEHALARTERKTAPGYHGFVVHAAPNVTLEDDLRRRDLTINAMARAADGRLIDPFKGQDDLRDGVLRHVSEAFAEDPVRILRLARFAARFPRFIVAPQTLALMKDMVSQGEVKSLVAERVWQELSRGLMAECPSRMFEVLRDCGALQVLLPEFDALFGVPQPPEHHPEIDTGLHVLMVLDQTAKVAAPLEVRFAALCHDLGKGTTPREQWPRHIGHESRSLPLLRAVCDRWRIPAACRELAQIVAAEHGHVHQSLSFGAPALLRLLVRCDAIRRPERFEQVLLACECDARGRTGLENRDYPQAQRLLLALKAALSVNTADLAKQAQAQGLQGTGVAKHIDAAREAQILQAGL